MSFLVRRTSASAAASRTRAPARNARVKGGNPSDGRTDGRTPRVYRWRKLLVPPIALLALVLTSLLGWLLNSGAWWLPFLGGGGLTLVCLLRLDRAKERAYALWSIGGGSVWTALAWRNGPTRSLLLLLLLSALPTAVVWWRHQRTRNRVRVVASVRFPAVGEWRTWAVHDRSWIGGRALAATVALSAWQWVRERPFVRRSRRDLAAIIDDWPATASNAGIPGSEVKSATADHAAYTLHVRLRPGQTHRQALDKLSELGSALHAIRGTLRIEVLKHMDEIRIRWVHDDPLAAAIIHWRPYDEKPVGKVARSVREDIPVGPYSDGRLVSFNFSKPRHTLICGMPQHGKSSVALLIAAALAGAPDVALWIVDPKQGVDFDPLAPLCDRHVRVGESVRLLRALWRLIEIREAKLAAARKRAWDPNLGPYVLVILDEFSQYPMLAKDLALWVAQKCLFVGIRLVVITQVPSRNALGQSTDLKEQLKRRVCTYLPGDAACRMVFGDDAKDVGLDPTKLPRPGSILVRDEDSVTVDDRAVDAQAWYPEEATLEEVAAREECTRLPADEAGVWDVEGPVEVELAHAKSSGAGPGRPTESKVVQLPGLEPDDDEDEESDDKWADERGQAELDRVLEVIRTAPRPLSKNEVMDRGRLTRHVVHQKGGDGAVAELARRGLVTAVEGTGGNPRWICVDQSPEKAQEGS